jgi:hypothetical protein
MRGVRWADSAAEPSVVGLQPRRVRGKQIAGRILLLGQMVGYEQ